MFFKYIENEENIYNDNDLVITDIYSLDGKVANGSEINNFKVLHFRKKFFSYNKTC